MRADRPSIPYNIDTASGLLTAATVNPITGKTPERPGIFYYARVTAITGGTSPTIEIRNGTSSGDLIASVAAAVGNVIDFTNMGVMCPAGVYLNITGAPTTISVLTLSE